jgi:pilus assembly protein FimV
LSVLKTIADFRENFVPRKTKAGDVFGQNMVQLVDNKHFLNRIFCRPMNKKILLTAIFLLFAGFQSAAQALALGELELKSYLNQPLNVVIPLVFSTESELVELKLSISGSDEQTPGSQAWHKLKVEIVENEGNQPYLKISSKDTLREPALSFVLDMRWPSGRIQRNYSLLLDPKP